MEFPKVYTPSEFESSLAEMWEKKWLYAPKKSKTGQTFYIPLPPPNVTGVLHTGHALMLSLQDVMIRYHRMKGDETLWVPGTDHAGISTQNVVTKNLAKEWIRKEVIGREAFLEKVWEWKEACHGTITGQMRMMGASVSWDHERFTLDEGNNKLVTDTFVKLYNDGIIYRGEYMVNYCPKDKTVISNAEIIYREEPGFLYEIAYFVSGADKELVVATTRPETLLADMAIAVHPKDKRYKKLIGKTAILPIANRKIPIIADEMVDMDFWTGAVKITPAHDPADFETAKRHNLTLDYRVLDNNGIMMEHTGDFAGKTELQAREMVVDMLRARGNLMKVTPHVSQVGYSERGNVRVQTIVSTQWFVDNQKLKEKVMAGWANKEFDIVPDRFGPIFENMMNNLHDWCISRQLWWGHQIPAYYDKNTGDLLGVTDNPAALIKKHGKDNVVRDEDVLDTWFSSALWPLSVLDWNFQKPGELFQKYYPAQVLETGHDILFFWVVRMLLFGYELTGETPFKTIYLHGLVTDDQGRKFSKSLGNGIDPIEVIKQYSADALRLSLIVGNSPGNPMRFSMDVVKSNQTFLNKLWNVARFVWMNVWEGKDMETDTKKLEKTLTKNWDKLVDYERWILTRLKRTVTDATVSMEKYDFSMMGEKLLSFTRDEFADYAIECFKLSKDESKYGKEVMTYTLLTLLKLWHPYIPFVTEALNGVIAPKTTLIDAEWPECPFDLDEESEELIRSVFEVVKTIRTIRGERKIKPGDAVDVVIYANPRDRATLERNISLIAGLGKASNVEFTLTKEDLSREKYTYGMAGEVEVFVDTSSCTHDDDIERLEKLIAEKEDYARMIELKLMDATFVSKAPENVIRLTQEKKEVTLRQIEKAREELRQYKG